MKENLSLKSLGERWLRCSSDEAEQPHKQGSAMVHIALFHFLLQSVLNCNGKLLFPIFLPTHSQTQLTKQSNLLG